MQCIMEEYKVPTILNRLYMIIPLVTNASSMQLGIFYRKSVPNHSGISSYQTISNQLSFAPRHYRIMALELIACIAPQNAIRA